MSVQDTQVYTSADASCVLNIPTEGLLGNVRVNSLRDLPWVSQQPAHDGTALLVGGGPSLARHIEEIRWRASQGQTIFALNGAATFLCKHGIVADYQVMLDARRDNRKLIERNVSKGHYLASQCHPDVVDKAGKNVTLFHAYIDDIDTYIPQGVAAYTLIGGGCTVGLVASALTYVLGFRSLHLYGYDSSCEETGRQHSYFQFRTKAEARKVEVLCGGEEFHTTPVLLAQAKALDTFTSTLTDMGCSVSVHGDGLLPKMIRLMDDTSDPAKTDGVLELAYNFETHPASWNTFEWCLNVETYRLRKGYKKVFVRFVDGPQNGFRREEGVAGLTTYNKLAMLHGVCRPMLKLFGFEEGGTGAAMNEFPYTPRQTVDAVLAGAPLPAYEASERATQWARWYKGHYVITLREARYWPARNSNIDAWVRFAATLDGPVVFVRDTLSAHITMKDFKTDSLASKSIDHRLALYRAAKMNFFVDNGPALLARYSTDIPYMIFMKRDASHPCQRDDWLRQYVGFGHGEQMPWATSEQRTVWADDTFENIDAAFRPNS